MNLLRFSVQMKNDHQNEFLRNFTAAFDVYAFCICVDVPAEFDLKRFQRGVNAFHPAEKRYCVERVRRNTVAKRINYRK